MNVNTSSNTKTSTNTILWTQTRFEYKLERAYYIDMHGYKNNRGLEHTYRWVQILINSKTKTSTIVIAGTNTSTNTNTNTSRNTNTNLDMITNTNMNTTRRITKKNEVEILVVTPMTPIFLIHNYYSYYVMLHLISYRYQTCNILTDRFDFKHNESKNFP